MDFTAWNSLLFALKWVFIALIYVVLFFVLVVVRREMSQHLSEDKPAPSTAPGRLKVVNPGSDPRTRPGAIISLRPVTTLGVQPDNDVVLADQFVSRRHARLHWDGVGWWVEDLGSRNGTYINNIRCPSQNPQPVPLGATIHIGDMAFELVD